MRKIVCIAVVGFMMLSLFAFFGGVVEEVQGTATYDSGSNTIFINNAPNTLSSILVELNIINPGIFYYDSLSGTYSTNASIQINNSGRLDITYSPTERGLYFDFNSSQPLKLITLGILTVSGSESGAFRFDSNESSSSKGDWQGLFFQGNEASNSNLDYSEVFNSTIGISCDDSNPNIQNSIMAENGQYGLSILNSAPNLLNNKIYNNGLSPGNGGVFSQDSKATFENCTLSNSPFKDFIILGNSDIIALNSTFDSTKVDIFPPSQITVKWYLHVLIRDSDTGDPIPGVDVDILNKTGVPIQGNPFITDGSGYIRWIKIIEYIENASTGLFDHTPHNISATHIEYYSNYSIQNIDTSKQIQIFLNMIKRDLTTNEENITFTPSGVPVAGENLQIQAVIHNIESDNATNVRVIIEDNGAEIHNSTIGLIEGFNFKNAIDIWPPTAGSHTIWVYIDPFDEISEVGPNGETNNDVSVSLPVNARPIANISQPSENQEINETNIISGTSWDDPTDDIIELPGNDISRIDIRLEGYGWISLSPPFIFNISSGGWDWLYNWDDPTQWNGTPIADGSYKLQARSWDNYHFSNLYEVNITVNNTGANEPPVALINEPLNNTFYSVNESITFNGSLSYDPNNDTLIYLWDFNDGNFSSGSVTTHSFGQKGTYNVSLTVNDTQAQDTAYVTVIVDNSPPYAEVTSSTDSGFVNQTITFYGYNSTDEETPNTLTFFWDFDNTNDTNGDGDPTNDANLITFSPIENASYIYTEPNVYTITLNVSDGRINSTDTVVVTINPNAAPNAVIDSPLPLQSFSVNESILFNATSSSDPNDGSLQYFWDFGDGSNSSWINESTTTHFYKQTGPLPFENYTIILTVRDAGGLLDSAFVGIFVNNDPPVANATSNVTTAPTNQDINFDGSGSDDDDGTIISYQWDFDDGNTSTSTNVDHFFTQDGIYNVTLTVTDNDGANDTEWIIITITNRDPRIDIVTLDPDPPKMDEQVTFNVSASDMDGEIVRYRWEFGDGFSYSENVTDFPDGGFDGKTNHIYSSKSTFIVTITIEDDDGATNTTNIFVSIANTPPTVIINSPAQDESVSGFVTIDGTADDADGSVSEVEIKINSEAWQAVSGTNSWSFTWDTSTYFNGQHTIYVRAFDSEDYTDPLASVTVNVSNPRTSITVTEFLNPSSVPKGGNVTVSGNVLYNTGEAVVNANVNISIMNEPGYWETNTDSNGFYSIDITAPSASGPYWVDVEVKKGTFTAQTNEKLTVQEPPTEADLEITSADISFDVSNPYSGDSVQITVKVNNIGTAEATNVVVKAYLGDPSSGGEQITPDGTKTISKLSGEDFDFAIFTWDTTNEVGFKQIYVVVDPSDSIAEADENNNQASKSISISGRPDFAIDDEDITFSEKNPVVGEPLTIIIKLHNIGTDRATVTYKVYDGDPDSDGILIESGEESLGDDEDATVLVTWTPGEDGEHLIFVVLEPKSSSIEEDDDTNNIAHNSVIIEKLDEEGEPFPWVILIMIILIVVVVIILLFLSKRGKGSKPRQDLPVASVVRSSSPVEAVEVEEEPEEKTVIMEGQGGVRL